MPAGLERPQGSGPASEAAQPARRPNALVHARAGARARARFKPDGRGPGISERERGAMEGRG